MRRTTQTVIVWLAFTCPLILAAQDVDTSRSEMRATIDRYTADRAIQNRSYPIEFSAANQGRMKQFYTEWLARLDRIDFDGRTDIWGLIYRPLNFDPSKKYPVIESIYAGPQGSFVPKRFSVATQALTELGFIVVQIDGMGTNNRSKAFHDVAFKNLGDAGLPDRILWHQAAAAKYPYYDISRVGVFGTSAGGQNALGALLFHPEFYKVAVSNSGCHDNRMDKIWWNEHWMSWPVGPQYAASSNVDNAHKLQGKLLLVYGELDTNVDPSSTLQVANALIRANKKFDLLAVPGGGHGAGGAYYQRLLQDFFVHHLQGVEPPDWNKIERNPPAGVTRLD